MIDTVTYTPTGSSTEEVVQFVRWWRVGDTARESLIHVRNDRGSHNEVGRTACGKSFPVSNISPPPYMEMYDENGKPDREDRYCESCIRALPEIRTVL